ncbi:arabinofuranosyltransferase [Micromonospora sp. H33]|uniref:arabinofuranosyltransferase n=1 Tax=Micromonospora sp. H33 TaxID=3452215 RepID=UPI003F89A584
MTSSVDEGSSAARTVTGTAEADPAPVVAQAGSRADADSTTRGATDPPSAPTDPPSAPTDPPTALRAEDAPSEPAERPSDATPEHRAAEDGPAEGDAGPAWHRRFRPRIGAPTIAVLTWAAAYPGGAALVKIVDADPFTARGALVPAGAAIVGGLLLFALALWRSSDRIIGLVAGGYAAWVGLTLIASYNGSPFGDSGLRGDSARLAAMATKFTVHTQPVDGIVSSVPSEYPPLFPFLLGRLALQLDQPAWSLIGYGEATLISLAVLVAFVLWRGIVPAWVALALAVLPPWVFSQPRKSYEIVTLAVFVPWVLRTFTDRSRREGGLHWLAAGVIGGLLLMTYQGYVMFAAVGLVVLVVGSFWRSRHRWRYLGHLVGVGATAFVVAAWYLIPYLRGTLTIGGSRVNDYFISPAIVEDPLGVWYLKAPLSAPLHVLQICGLVGLAWYWRKRWWARPLLLVLLGAYAYRWAFVLIFMHNGHTLYLHYTTRLLGLVLASGGILALVEAGRALAARLRVVGSLRRVALVGTAGLLVLAGLSGAGTWMPSPPGLDSVKRPEGPQNYNLAVYTHAEPLPDGSRQRYPAPDEVTVTWFPAEPIRRVVHETLGPDALPVTLSYDERMYAYQPWPGYMAVERLASNTWTHWDDRRAEVVRLSGITDPAEFTRATKDTRFGEIDVFVLRRRPAGWHFGSIVFNPKQFDPAVWRIDDTVPNGVVVAVRKPGT